MADRREIEQKGKAHTSAGKPSGWHTIQHNGSPYMTRIWIGRLRLHIFYRGDTDPDAHDHPWDFWTFPLTNYVEEVVTQHVARLNLPDQEVEGLKHTVLGGTPFRTYTKRRQIVRAWRWSFRPAEHCHRVLGRFAGEWDIVDRDGTVVGTTNCPYAGSGFTTSPIHDNGKIITLVWRSKPKRAWGFLKSRDGRWCWQPWKDYAFGGGRSAPCE